MLGHPPTPKPPLELEIERAIGFRIPKEKVLIRNRGSDEIVPRGDWISEISHLPVANVF